MAYVGTAVQHDSSDHTKPYVIDQAILIIVNPTETVDVENSTSVYSERLDVTVSVS